MVTRSRAQMAAMQFAAASPVAFKRLLQGIAQCLVAQVSPHAAGGRT